MTATRYSIDVPDEGGVDTLPSSGAEASPQPVATWLKLVDFALFASILLLIFTEQKIFYFHLVFVLLTFGAFYWQLQGFVLRAGIYVSVITLTLIAFVITGHIHSEELVEIPMMTTILLLVFTIARQRTLAEDALREANDGLEKRVLARTAALRQEVSEHRKTAQTLWASEARYRHLVQLAFEAIVIHTETEILYLNPAGMELFGLVGPTELQGRSFLEFVHPDERESVALSLQQVQSEGKGVPLTERKFIRCDGNEIDVETATISILDNGQAALQTVIRDISIRKQTEQARLDERMSIARDLHDSIGQSLGYLHLKLDEIVDYASLQPLQRFRHEFIAMREVANTAYEQVRGLLAALLPTNTMQLAQALRRHANTLRQQGHCQIKVINRGDEQLLPAVLQQQILSLCSEALANIAKHAQAQHARVELWWALDTLTVIIEDDGVGFDLHTPPVSNSFGIRIMQDRAVQMAGQLEIQSQHLVGTKLTLHVPLSLG